MWPALPGFVNAVSGIEVSDTWRRFYQVSFFFGYIVSGSLFWMLNKISPPPGVGEQVEFDLDGSVVVEEVFGADGATAMQEK